MSAATPWMVTLISERPVSTCRFMAPPVKVTTHRAVPVCFPTVLAVMALSKSQRKIRFLLSLASLADIDNLVSIRSAEPCHPGEYLR